MAIVKTNFLSAELNQFAISTVRGQLADWGLNAQIMEVRIDDEEASTIYAGDPVKLVSSPKGVITVKAAEAGDAVYGFMIWDTKRTKATAGQYIRVLRDGGIMQMITDEAITAGTAVYIDETDGGVSATGTGLGDPIGLAVEDSTANSDGSLIRIEVVKAGLGASALATRLTSVESGLTSVEAGLTSVEAVIPSGASSSNKLLDKTTADATYEPKAA